MVRELAGHDPAKYDEVFRWPIGEALAAYENQLRDDARQDYEFAMLLWAIFQQSAAKRKKPPELPAILRA